MKVITALLAGLLYFLLVYPVIPVTFSTPPKPPAPHDLTDGLSETLKAIDGHKCVASGTWKSKDVPSWAVVKYLNGKVVGVTFDKAWDLATNGKVWVLLVCEE
jgi:hypothetical protein